MFRKLFSKIIDAIDTRSKNPRATFAIDGFDEDGRIKVTFNWNAAFIKKIRSMGFDAETDEDCVQLFYYTSQMRPSGLGGDDPVQPTAHPGLSDRPNTIIRQ